MKDVERSVRDCPVNSVVVYLDQAEVTRSVKVSLQEGETQVVLTELSPSIDKDSIRVEGRGAAKINEVIFSSKKELQKNAPNEGDETPDVDEKQRLQDKEKELKREQKMLDLKHRRIDKQLDVWKGIGEHVAKSGKENQETGGFVSALSTANLEGVTKFFALHKEKTNLLDTEKRVISSKKKELEAELKVIDSKLKKLIPKREEGHVKREVRIILEAEKESDVDLWVSYLVSEAGWEPKYDLRVFSKDKKMQINYFAMIKQCTGEEWTDTKLELSTAMPSVGGSAPVLPTRELSFKRIPPPMKSFNLRRGLMSRALASSGRGVEGYGGGGYHSDDKEDEEDDLCEFVPSDGMPPPMPAVSAPTAKVKSGISGATYEVVRPSTIPSDDVGHKVTVAQIPLEPQFEYESVPKLTAYAFLKAKVKNKSKYSFLAGPANVFLDNNFVAKSSLNFVSPDEEFECSLGVDAAIRVTYKPLKKSRGQVGVFAKSTLVKLEQHIEIKNTRADAIKIKVCDQLPLSTDDKIKVALTEPEFRKGEKAKTLGDGSSVKLNKDNNLEWEIDLASGKTHTVKLHYTIEHPHGLTVQGL